MIINTIEYLVETCSQHPDRIAVRDATGSWTFAELDDASRRIAAHLIRLDSQHKRPIAVLLPKSAACVSAFLGVLYSGNFYVPLDPASPVDRLQRILKDLNPLCVISSGDHREKLESLLPDRGLCVDLDAVLASPTAVDQAAISRRVATMIDMDPIYIKYTSGSTGDPKGVVLPHRAVIDYIEWAADTYQLSPEDVVGNQAPFTFDVSVQDIYLTLKSGATLLLIPEQHFIFPARLVQYLAENRVSFFCWVPSVLASVCHLNLLDGVDTSHLKWVTVLGEVMPTRPFRYWQQHCPSANLVNTYGPTETAIASTFYVLDRDFQDDEPLPIGIPCRNTEIVLLGDEDRVVAGGETGEICIRGSGLALGYWNDPAKTAGAFAQLPIQTHYPERMYRTGDLGHWNDRGELMFCGRRDSQIKHMGYRIELGEIEAAAGGLPGIQRVCVLYDPAKKAIILCYEGPSELDRAEVRRQLSTRLPSYMLPKSFRRTPNFPLNANGKIDRHALLAACLTSDQ